MDGEPAIVAVPDAVADDGGAAHGIAAEVEVKGIADKDAGLSEVPEFGVCERTCGAAVVHRVAANAGGIGGLDDDVAAQIRNLGPELAVALVDLFQRLVERE